MKHAFTIIFVCLTLASVQASEWIGLKNTDLEVSPPTGWFIKKDLLGFPLVLVSKSVNGQRASLSFTPSAHKDVTPSTLADFNSQYGLYKQGRQKWLRERDGELINFIPPQVKNFSHVSAGIVGFEYKLNNSSYIEYSINIFCEKRYVFSKLLYSKNDHPDAYQKALSVLESLECRSKE